jgi:hypothetical protein
MYKQKISLITFVIILMVVLGFVAKRSSSQREYLIYRDSLDDVAATVDDVKLTLRDLAFYVAYEEGKIEEEARIYNPEDTSEYWKKRLGNDFVRVLAKNDAMEMAIHDEIFYELAIQNKAMLDEDDKIRLKNSQDDFWNDLEAEGQEALGVTREEMDVSLEKVAIAEKYEWILTELNKADDGDYAFDGDAYGQIKEEHLAEINDDVWNRIFFGEITTSHHSAE